jgi:uncharacterized protein (DUF302 family)
MNSDNDIANIPCKSSVDETVSRIKSLLQEQGITIYNQIDQQVEASKYGLPLKPLQLLVFGNPKAGIPLMQINPLCGLDLPLKVLVWEDNLKKVWVSYYRFDYLQKRFDLPSDLIAHLSRAESIILKAISSNDHL